MTFSIFSAEKALACRSVSKITVMSRMYSPNKCFKYMPAASDAANRRAV